MTMIDRYGPLIDDLARDLGCEARALRAILRVESPGEGLMNGKPVVRLEINYFWSRARVELRPRVDEHFHVGGPRKWEGHVWRPVSTGPWIPMHQPGHDGQKMEWEALDLARSIDDRAAVESTSWGAGQVMGFHWQTLGYTSWTAFAVAQQSETEQLRTMARYIDRVVHLQGPLARRDWLTVATLYNGTGKADEYARDLQEAYGRG